MLLTTCDAECATGFVVYESGKKGETKIASAKYRREERELCVLQS